MKKTGGMWVGSTDDELTAERHLVLQFIEKIKGDWQHRREGLQIPGKLIAHLEEAAYHLALVVCNHLYSPCTPCLAWADLVMFSVAKEKEDENAERESTGMGKNSNVGSEVTQGRRSTKGTGKGGTDSTRTKKRSKPRTGGKD